MSRRKATVPIIPFITREKMEEILSARRPITSEEFYRQVAAHTGRPTRPGRKLISENGVSRWVCLP